MASSAARGGGIDTVLTNHKCDKLTRTGGCSTDTFINGVGAVRLRDSTAEHKIEDEDACIKHVAFLVGASTKVFINGRGAGRMGDTYGKNEIIITGSGNVFFG